MKWDLAQLYSQLDLTPDCSLEEFKRAYRRRIAALHPDKARGAAAGETGLLPELIWLYANASRFYRRHGRLPGAVPAHKTSSTPQPARPAVAILAAAAPSTPPAPGPARDPQDAPARRNLVLALLALLLVFLALAWAWTTPTTQETPQPGSARSTPAPAARAASAGQLELGMDAATVLAIQGKPLFVRDNRWDYGPSWLQFEEGRLTDWHSSPLRRLRTATPSPGPQPARREP